MNRWMKLWLQDNDIEMCLTQIKWKSVALEELIRTLENKIYKYMTLISKNWHIFKLGVIVFACNNTCNRTIKMKPIDVISNLKLLIVCVCVCCVCVCVCILLHPEVGSHSKEPLWFPNTCCLMTSSIGHSQSQCWRCSSLR